ncbi:MAG TPA: DUF1552 domain-containing protein [Steroidobacteraceae bacterium]
MSAHEKLSRRQVLRGVLGGAAVSVALPMLECFLDPNGTAYAATGASLPPIFGTWFWGLGLIPDHWEPKTTGDKYELPEHIAVLAPIKAKLNLYSGMQVFLDGKVNQNHFSGAQCQMTGMVSRTGSEYTTSLDSILGNHIGKRTRFRSIEVSCDGDRKSTWSARGANGMNPSEVSPLALYARLFGADFKDPNSADFTPDPAIMVRRSVLTGVAEQRKALMMKVSATDRTRLDEYFSSVRDLEQQLSVELERPSPVPSCSVPPKIESEDIGTLVDQTRNTHRQFAQLIAHALACGQTQVFNMAMGSSFSPLRKPGEATAYHQLTHEERIDPQLGYQPKCRWLAEQQMAFFLEMVQTLDSIREGDATLLDRSVVFAYTDHGEARLHSMKRYPVFTAGSGGGRMKTGFHLAAEGDAATRVGLTIQQALGISTGSWGTETNRATKPFSELLV